ncbi:MAG: hypothetical protein NTV86_22360 [Planctomycetota bacterium]|nr:hypothetical protein [Planctomycetota bacterium]
MRLQVLFNKQRALGIMVMLSTAMIVLGERVGEYVRIPAQYLVAPVGEATMYVVAGVKSHAGKSDKPISAEELEVFIRQQQMLAHTMGRQLQEFRSISIDMQEFQHVGKVRISQSYNPTPGVTAGLIPARVLAEDSLPYGQTRLVARGRRAGVLKGQSVVTIRQLVTDRAKALPEGLSVVAPTDQFGTETDRLLARAVLVGKVIQTSAFSAQMVLVTDTQFKAEDMLILRVLKDNPPRRITVDGREAPLDESNNEPIRVTAVGNGKELEIKGSVPAEHKVQKGDWLVMPYEMTYWPTDILVGLVSRVEDPGTGHQKVYVQPAADLSSLGTVYIMIPEVTAAPSGGGR